MTAQFRKMVDETPPHEIEAPRPLRREMPPAELYPLDALGPVLGDAAKAFVDLVQCPVEMAAQSVLGAASLSVQAYANVLLPPNDKPTPLSLFLVTVAASGKRKSAVDSLAAWPINRREQALKQKNQAEAPDFKNENDAFESARKVALRKAKDDPIGGKRALDALGPAPCGPLVPILLVPEPTLEGLHKLFAVGQPAVGLFSDEGGQFVGGNGMNDDNRLKTSAGLSDLWDGKPIRRIRAGDGATVMPGRRLAMHLMMQPDVAARLLSDPVLRDQGLLSRLLVAAPETTCGTRFQHVLNPASEPAIKRYGARLLSIMEKPLPLVNGTQNELSPRQLPLSDEALKMWSGYADHNERLLGPGGDLEPVRGFGNKLPEHAVRMAAVLALVDDIDAVEISGDAMSCGIQLAQFYAGEALRLFDASAVSLPIRQAEALLKWLHDNWDETCISLRQIYQFGPNGIRDCAKAKQAVALLVEHGWLSPLKGGATIKGQRCKDAWTIVKGA